MYEAESLTLTLTLTLIGGGEAGGCHTGCRRFRLKLEKADGEESSGRLKNPCLLNLTLILIPNPNPNPYPNRLQIPCLSKEV